jgi:hypothetical protein
MNLIIPELTYRSTNKIWLLKIGFQQRDRRIYPENFATVDNSTN